MPLVSLRSLVSLRTFSVDTMCVNKREVAVVITLIQNLLIKLVVLFYYLVLKLSYVQYLLDSANINFFYTI